MEKSLVLMTFDFPKIHWMKVYNSFPKCYISIADTAPPKQLLKDQTLNLIQVFCENEAWICC